jgi:acid phosphatase family membrane protein YuiD
MIPFLVWCIIQCIKLVIDLIVHRQLSRKALRWAGWFPSVHGWISASIATLMALEYGIHSFEFTLAFTFAFLFWYDATNVRYEAWQHALMLNKIGAELSSVLDPRHKSNTHPSYVHLKERLWHTVAEVVWGIIIWAGLTYLYREYMLLNI